MKENKKDKRILNILRTNKKRLMAAVLGLFLFCQPLTAMAAEWQRAGGSYQMPDGTAIQGAITRGIDVSHWKGVIDWGQVAAQDVSFVMLGTRYQGQPDPYFAVNAQNARAAGLKVGAYIYSYATSVEMAEQEADFVLNLIKDYPISFPVAFDAEDAGTLGTLTPSQVSEVINAFCRKIEEAGYHPMVYANETWLNSKIDLSMINYDIWVARYGTMYTYGGPSMWQATNKGSINGVNGAVDIDFLFKDYNSVIPADTWRTIGENQYYYKNYEMQKNSWIHDGTGFFFMNENGNPMKGWMTTEAGSYYLDETSGMMATGWKVLDGSQYLFSGEGLMTVGWADVDGARYYMNDKGVMQTLWLPLDGKWYYLGENGAMRTGWQNINGAYYYLDGAGVMQTGWQDIDGARYYLNASGIMQTDWLNLDGNWYYLNASGAMQTGWANINGAWYYLDGAGVQQHGWQDIDGARYYLNESGVMQTGWQEIEGSRYCFGESGAMKTGWAAEDGAWYYLNQSGTMEVGWQQIDGALYYLNPANGQLAVNTVLELEGVPYQADANGVCTPVAAETVSAQ